MKMKSNESTSLERISIVLRLNFISNRESKLKGNRDRKMRLKEV
jgi:hypothetical protein